MYVSSPEDTEEREVDAPAIGTIFYSIVRPEFRGPVRCHGHIPLATMASQFASGICRVPQVLCFLASTTDENRNRFRKVLVHMYVDSVVTPARADFL